MLTPVSNCSHGHDAPIKGIVILCPIVVVFNMISRNPVGLKGCVEGDSMPNARYDMGY